jgi:glycosyltransferase involved in cell wall biosynthesis
MMLTAKPRQPETGPQGDAPPFAPTRTYRFAFVMELQAGMRTQYLNWRHVVEREPNIVPTWVPVSYYEEGGWIERMRFLPSSVRGIWRGYLQTSRGLGREKFDAALFNTHNTAVVNRRAVYAQRAFLMFDVTPIQYDEMAFWYEQKADRGGWLAEQKRRRVRETFQAAEGLFAWSHWAAQSAIEDYGADPKRVSIVPPGVDTQLWRPAEPGCRPDDGIVRILFTGGNFARKGGDLLLRWARETRQKNWELHLVTLDQVEAPPGVVVHRNLGSNSAELIALAQKCDVFALPTRADCFSIASLEAMAAGLPVIAGRVGGIPDIVREGETGYLLDPDDYDGLCDRLDTLLDAPALRQEMGRKGREVVCAQFELAALVRRGLGIMAEGR